MLSSSAPRWNRRLRKIIASSSIRPSSATTSGATPSCGSSGSLHHGERLLVAEPVVDPDRRPGELVVGADAVGVELDEGADRVPGPTGLEARQAVGEDFGEHRDDAVGQVNARPPEPGGLVEARTRWRRSARRRRCGRPGSSSPGRRATREIASSKSRAVAGSIVTVRTSRRSSRSFDLVLLEMPGLLAGLVEDVVVEDVGDVEGADHAQGVDARAARGGRGPR